MVDRIVRRRIVPDNGKHMGWAGEWRAGILIRLQGTARGSTAFIPTVYPCNLVISYVFFSASL